jgi:hypothetical protein
MIAGDDDLEAIPLPSQGQHRSMGIVIPERDPPSTVAESFFEIARSTPVRENIAQALAGGKPTHK